MEVLPMSNVSISSLYPFRRVKIENCSQIISPDHGTVIFTELNPDMRFNPICHECGSKAEKNHSWHSRPLNDLKLGHANNHIILRYRKIYCPNCGIKVEQLNVTEPGGPAVTNRLAQYIYDLCKHMTVQEVADHLNLDWKTVKNIDKHFLEKEFDQTDYNHSGFLAINDFSFVSHSFLLPLL